MIRVSVIIPTYNAEKVLERCILSVLCQDFNGEVEILVCDDCSTDNTVKTAKRLGAKVFLNKENTGGPNKGRNVGIQNATGDYIAFLDQDDWWFPDKLEKQLKELENGADFVYSQSITKKK